ncbi:MAG: ribonuclease P protein component [Porphyromonadaceae bacterium]|nr:ribonuclease P protein component [Porphyromonadaceae bacterium]
MPCRNRLTAAERLRGEIRIKNLFLSGKSFIVYPYRVVYDMGNAANPLLPSTILVSVSKKRFKQAVRRNRLRRCIKEAFRLNKSLLNDSLQAVGKTVDMAILYLDREVLPYATLEKSMKELLQKLSGKILSEDSKDTK